MNFNRTTQAFAALTILASMMGTAYAAPEDPAGAELAAVAEVGNHAVTAKACPSGFFRVGTNLCMTGALGPDTFANALAVCQSLGAGVAGYGPWRYRILFGDGVMPPVGWWLGPITADNTALFVNQASPGDFDGETSRFDSRNYACSKG